MRRGCLAFVVVLLGVLLLLAACAKAEPTPTPPPAATPTPPAAATPTAPAAAVPFWERSTSLSLVPAPKSYPAAKPGVYKTYEEALADWPQVEAAAKKEGTLLLAGSAGAPGTEMAGVIAAFEKKTGITVDYVGGAGVRIGDILPKLKAEKATGKYTMDGWNSGPTWIRLAAKEGFSVPYITPNALEPGVPWTINPWQEGVHVGTGGQIYRWVTTAPVVNTNLVPPERYPKTYLDLEDPWWKGKIGMEDPRGYGPIGDYVGWVMATTAPGYGERHLKALFANIGRLYDSSSTVLAAVVKGEIALDVTALNSALETYAKLPQPWSWKFLIGMEPGDQGHVHSSLLFPNAPHPNAFKVLANFMISMEAEQVRSTRWGVGGIRQDSPHVTPELIRPKKFFPVDYADPDITLQLVPDITEGRGKWEGGGIKKWLAALGL